MNLYRRALGYYRPDWYLVLAVLGLIALVMGLEIAMAWPAATMVNQVLAPVPKGGPLPSYTHWIFWFLPGSLVGQLVGLAIIAVVIKVLRDLLAGAHIMVNALLNYRGLTRVRGALYAKLQALDMGFHHARPQGDSLYRVITDSWGPQEILQSGITATVAAVRVVVLVSVLLYQNVMLTLIALVFLPPLVAVNLFFARRLRARQADVKVHEAAFMTSVQHGTSSVGLVQAYGRQQDDFSRFGGSLKSLIAAWFRQHWIEAGYQFSVGLVLAVGAATAGSYGGFLVYRDTYLHPDPAGMSPGGLLAFCYMLGMLWDPLMRLTGAPAAMQRASVAARRVFEVLDHRAAVRECPEARALPIRPRTLVLKDVCFAYEENRPVLQEVSLTITPGQMVAFVGTNGAGKSTLLGLLMRFQDPSTGAVLLDGQDLRELRLADARGHVALVPQDAMTFPGTIWENIAFGRPDATEAELREAAALAGVDAFVGQLPHGYATLLAEGGANLSGGQRQRIAIARALLAGAPIVALDEPTSALDPAGERLVTESLESLGQGEQGGRTVVLVTHRLNTVTGCDQIFVLDAGRIVERGTHEELLARDGLYARMWRQEREDDRVKVTLVA